MRIGICTNVDLLPAAHEAGYDFAEMAVASLAPAEDEATFAAIREQILAAPIKVEAFNCFVPGNLKVTGPAVDLEAVARHMEIALRRTAEVGATIMVFGSGGARRAPEGWPLEQARAQYAEAAKLAAEIGTKHGVMIVLEPLSVNECNHFNWVEQGVQIAEQVDHPNLQVLADMYHMATTQEPNDHLIAAGTRLMHVHIDTQQMSGIEGGGNYDYAAFLETLAQAGYEGRISVEDHSGMLNREQAVSKAEIYRRMRDFVVSCLPVTA